MEIRKVNVLSEPQTVQEISFVYQQSFGHGPWFEGYRCPVCSSVFELKEYLSLCPKCNESGSLINLIEYWPKAKVISDFYEENTKEDSLCLVAEENNTVVGFVWGYRLDISLESATKIDAPKLSKIYQRTVFYLDECAVLPKFQGHGIGRALVQQILKKQPYDMIILRTLADSPMQRLIEKLGGEKILSISENRIIMKLIKTENLHKFISPPHY